MNPRLLLLTLFVLPLAAGCKRGLDGIYALDKDATAEALKSRFHTDGLGIADATLQLSANGTWEETTIPEGHSPADRTESVKNRTQGRFSADGDTVKLSGGAQDATCRLSETRMECDKDPAGAYVTQGKDSPVIFNGPVNEQNAPSRDG